MAAQDERIGKVISSMITKGIKVSSKNISTNSLFSTGGTISEKEAKEYLKRYVNIGFCQPKFYKVSVWNRAKKLMNYLVSKKLAIKKDFGRGKGKYDSKYSVTEILKKIG